jgi:pyridoxamine 5'-phosphate oxidase
MPLDFEHPPPDPLAVMHEWLTDAARTFLPNPNAMSLATIDADGRPSSRIVLLRGLDERGAVFFTNRRSRKGLAIGADARAALLFHWDPLDRQLRIEGSATQTSDAESDDYFSKRQRMSQINAWASDQSESVDSRATMLRRQEEMARRFEGAPVPRPPHWGGYRISLDRIEFWQGDPHRLHDRIRYERDPSAGWRMARMYP